jgi:NADPH:quinone reductase-like Zn-dependent oxidoreductase
MWQVFLRMLGSLSISFVVFFVLDYILWRQYRINSQKMDQVVYDTFSKSPDVLSIKQMPTIFEPYRPIDRLIESMFGEPIPTVKLKVHYVALNPVDVKMLKGNLKLLNHGKRVGFEFAGTIITLYHSIYGSRFVIGDRVCGMLPISQVGALSEYLRVPESWISKVPHSMPLKEACTIPMACLTACLMTKTMPDLNKAFPTRSVLVLGGNTSVGRMAIQIIRGFDSQCTIYATMRTDHTAFINQFNVHPLDYTAGDWWDQLVADPDFDASRKFCLIVDTVGGKQNWMHGKDYVIKNGEYSTCVGDDQTAFTIGEILKRGVQILKRNGKAGYSQVVCQGGDAEPLMQHLPYVRGNPGLEYDFTDQGVQDALKQVTNAQKGGKPVIRIS